MPNGKDQSVDEEEIEDETPVTDRGKLISKSVDDAFDIEVPGRIKLPYQYVVLLIASVAMAVTPFLLPFEEDWAWFFALLFYTIGGSIFIMAFVVLLPVPKKAIRVFENGADLETWKGVVYFVSWGLFSVGWVKEKGDRKTLKMRGVLGTGTISDDMPHYEDFAEDIEERLGKEKYRFVEPGTALERHALLGKYLMNWLIAYVITSTAVIAAIYTFLVDFHESVLILMVLLGFIVMALCFIPGMIKWFLNPNRALYIGLNMRKTAAMFTIALVVLYSLFIYGYVEAIPDLARHDDDIHVTLSAGDTTIEPGVYTDQVLTATGPVTVREGETLRLVNCTLRFDPAPAHDWGLWVAEGGTLFLEDTLVMSVDRTVGYTVELHGKARIVNTTIDGLTTAENLWSEEDQGWFLDFGFEIYNDDVVVEGSTILESIETGLVTYRCSPTITNTTFIKCGRTSLIVKHGSPIISNCTFDEGYRGIRATNATVDVRDCTFIGNNYGAVFQWCEGSVIGNHFEINSWEALTTVGSDLELEDNTFIGNGKDVTQWDLVDPFELMLLFMVLINPMIFLGFTIKDLFKAFKKKEGTDE